MNHLNYTASISKNSDEGWVADIAKIHPRGVWEIMIPAEDSDPYNGNFDGELTAAAESRHYYPDHLAHSEVVAPPHAERAVAEYVVRQIIERLAYAESPSGIADAAARKEAADQNSERLSKAQEAYESMTPAESLAYVNALRNGPPLGEGFAGKPHVRNQFLALYEKKKFTVIRK
jgi:hypothetical protein